MSRLFKQIIYGLFYLAVTAGIGYGGYLVYLETAPTCFDSRLNQKEEEVDCGGPCESCLIRHLQPIQARVEYFGIGGNTSAILTFINPNLEYGAESFDYSVAFLGAGRGEIFSLNKSSFIYPAEAQKIVVEPNLKFDPRLVSGEPAVVISNIIWRPLTELNEPKFQFRQQKTEVSGSGVTVSGLLSNREGLTFSRATVNLLVFRQFPDETTDLVGASKTVLQNLQPFEERSFRIVVPLDVSLKLPEIDTILTAEIQK